MCINKDDLKLWSDTLHKIAEAPLELCPQFPLIARRFEAWWNCEVIDRPLFIAAPTNPGAGKPAGRRLDILTDSDLWFNTKKEDMLRMNWIGDSIPNIRIDFGPTALGTLIGSQFHFESDTTWFTPSISNDWSNATAWSIDDNDKWWRIMCGLAERVAADAAGRYLLCTPAYEASADVVLNLRGTSEFCIDIIDRPQKISQSIDALYPCWQKTLKMLYDTSIRQGTGLTTWMRIWSNEPFAIVAADVGYMLSPEDFKKVILPSVAREASKIGRAIFHIDGPPMWRH
ncbi:MAG: hypothetical protein A2Y12_18005 [Planctomycetes bacterium GWF2_42_9]|nr:MAG: hypothetical protein A2Y12_18005 [Planctomycetes bacterium GWF2_42_9]